MATVTNVSITDILHPWYRRSFRYWRKWRLAFEGGENFMDAYLQRFVKSEDVDEFNARRAISYSPSFAKAAVIEIRDSIYQRLSDISRVGGTPSYMNAVQGLDGGVDMLSSSMNVFMGTEVLEELLVIGKVGVYVDMPPVKGPTLADNNGVRPYLYSYQAEDIRSWDDDESPVPNQYKAVLLRDRIYERNNPFGLPSGEIERYRYYYRDVNGDVWVQFYDVNARPTTVDGEPGGEPIKLNISRIPFVIFDIGNSLMCDIADYQIALLNLASSDMAYAVGANFPFYTEQVDPKMDAMHLRQPTDFEGQDDQGGVVVEDGGSINDSGAKNIKTGPNRGRLYGKGLERPGFVHPSSEPMKASMEKQKQLMMEIRLLLNLTIADLQAKGASAESKGLDIRTLESGLSYIGLNMEDGERQIGEIWSEYENSNKIPTIQYPEKYSLRSQADVEAEIKALKAELPTTPSDSAQKVIAKRIIELLIGHRVSSDTLRKIYAEVDKAKVVSILVDKIEKDVELGYLSPELAAETRGYPKDDLQKAEDARIERIKQTQIAQAKGGGFGAAAGGGDPNNPDGPLKNPAARGNPDLSPTGDPTGDVKAEKAAAGNPVRGKSA